jgi:uncharacterized protein
MQLIDIRDLNDHPGSSRRVRLREAVPGLALQLAEVPEDAPIEGELLLESVVEGIFVSGAVQGSMTLECARCLTSFHKDFSVEVGDLFVPNADPAEDAYALTEPGSLDPEPMVRDAVLLSMPFSPLCRPDCRGLCERCGGDRNQGECSCSEIQGDPRWAGLEQLFN